MKQLKRFLGLLWLVAGPALILILVKLALENIDPLGKSDINKPIPWVIIISIFTPIAVGFMVFGWYSWKGEYDDEIKS